MALIGVGAKIVFSLYFQWAFHYLFSASADQNSPLTLRRILYIALALQTHLLAFGLVIALAYRYKCVLLNVKNIILCCTAAIITEACIFAWFYSPLYNLFASTVFSWIDRQSLPYFISHQIYSLIVSLSYLLIALAAIFLSAYVFRLFAKPDISDNEIPPATSRFMVLLAFVCILCGIMFYISTPQTTTTIAELSKEFIRTEITPWKYLVFYLVFVNITAIIFLWFSYRFTAVYFQKDDIPDKHNVIPYVLLTFAALVILSVAFGFAFAWGLSKFSYYGAKSGPLVISCIIIIMIIFPWIYVRVQSGGVCFVLAILFFLQFLGIYVIMENSSGYIDHRNSEILLVIAVLSITIQLISWLLYSFAIQIGAKKLATQPI